MKLIALSALVLLAASQVAVAQQGTTTTTPPAPPAVAEPAKPAEEPKMVCRNEAVTGSRTQKQRICRPANEATGDRSTALQRELDKFGGAPELPTGFGN
jgi:hypothetical protein